MSIVRALILLLLMSLGAACQSGEGPTAPTLPGIARAVTPPPGPPIPTGVGPRYLTPPELAPTSASDRIVGRYQLELAIGADCAGLPASERIRRYVADIEAERREGYDYVVRLYGASFLEALACHDPRWPDALKICHQFRASGTEAELRFDFFPGPDDNWRGNMIYEPLEGDAWLGVLGAAAGRMSGSSIIAAVGGAYVERWTGGLGGTPGASYTTCAPTPSPSDSPPATIRLTFTR